MRSPAASAGKIRIAAFNGSLLGVKIILGERRSPSPGAILEVILDAALDAVLDAIHCGKDAFEKVRLISKFLFS